MQMLESSMNDLNNLFNDFFELSKILAKYQMPELRKANDNGTKPLLVGFFHPYCNAGGGGEMVLWSSIKALQQRYDHVRCVVYTGDIEATKEEILQKVKERFNIELLRTDDTNLFFCYLHCRKLVEASTYPRLTLLGQSLGSVFLGLEALFKFIPDVYIDTMGYSFTLPLFKYLAGCKVACYVHYPTISSDMLEVVSNRENAHNNASYISQSCIFSFCKLMYYKMFAWTYGFVGRFSNLVMVNSSWTRNHIMDIWKVQPIVVYPPCNVEELLKLSLEEEGSENDYVSVGNDGEDVTTEYIISVAQFRPEKNHKLQLRAFKMFLENIEDNCKGGECLKGKNVNFKSRKYKLLLVGGCRNEEDKVRVEELKNLAEELNIKPFVDFKLNIPFDELKEYFKKSSVGLHTMWNEHFGISVVECMAAGVIILAHDSGGPKMDIVINFEEHQTGFLASDEKSYSDCLIEIFSSSSEKLLSIKKSARMSVKRFSCEKYFVNFLNAIQDLIQE